MYNYATLSHSTEWISIKEYEENKEKSDPYYWYKYFESKKKPKTATPMDRDKE
jgi:hypothetical protein